MEFDYRTFFCDIEEKHFDEVEKVLVAHDVEQYLLAHESHNREGKLKPHFHFLVFTTEKNLRALVKVYVEKYDLRNTTGAKGGVRRYGTHAKGKPLHDVEKFATYLCKGGNVRSTFPEEALAKYMKDAYQKDQSNIDSEVLLSHLLEQYPTETPKSATTWEGTQRLDYFAIEKKITKEAITHIIGEKLKIPLSKPGLRRIFFEWVKRSHIANKATLIYTILYESPISR